MTDLKKKLGKSISNESTLTLRATFLYNDTIPKFKSKEYPIYNIDKWYKTDKVIC